jgi:ABC-type hemin transport system ATPase subunit
MDYLFEKANLKWIFSGAMLILFADTFKPNLDNKRHVREAVQALKELKTDETSVIICSHDFVLNFAYYYDISLFKDVDQITVYDRMISKLNQESIYPDYSMPFYV